MERKVFKLTDTNEFLYKPTIIINTFKMVGYFEEIYVIKNKK